MFDGCGKVWMRKGYQFTHTRMCCIFISSQVMKAPFNQQDKKYPTCLLKLSPTKIRAKVRKNTILWKQYLNKSIIVYHSSIYLQKIIVSVQPKYLFNIASNFQRCCAMLEVLEFGHTSQLYMFANFYFSKWLFTIALLKYH